jgi:hypothetical protein
MRLKVAARVGALMKSGQGLLRLKMASVFPNSSGKGTAAMGIAASEARAHGLTILFSKNTFLL